MPSNYTFREIAGLTTLLKVLLGLFAAMAVAAIISSCMEIELLNRWGDLTQDEVDANDLREGIIALFNLVLFLFTVVIFGKWIVRANRNVRALGATDLLMTPGWVVGFFFIPIANLWKPYQAMK